MSNRNFDGRVIIQRLQQQNYARNLYKNNVGGNGSGTTGGAAVAH